MRPTTILLIGVALFGSGIAVAHEPKTATRFAVGKTGVNCAMAPCPWRGIVNLDGGMRSPLRPLWSGEKLPSLTASPEDAKRLHRTWDDMGCLQIEGAWDGKALRVDRVLGACR